MENVQNFLKSLFCANLITKSHNQGVKEQGLAEDVRESPSYPGMKSYYRIHVVDCNITIEDDEDLQEEFQITEGETEPFQVRELTGDKHVFEWVDEKKAREEYKVLIFDLLFSRAYLCTYLSRPQRVSFDDCNDYLYYGAS